VISPGKELIKHHFSHHPELEAILKQRGKDHIVSKISPIHGMAKFSYVYQNDPLGDGHAILQAEELVGNEPFAVMFGDDIVKHDTPALKQVIDRFSGESVIGVEQVPLEHISSYGVIKPGEQAGRLYKVEGLIEKPEPHEAPSDFGIIGKFVCPFSIFEAIRQGAASKGNELRLIDGFIKLSEKEGIWAYHIEGQRFDTGRAEGLIAANNAFM
jgi:UTP--glucose-1-phosphate uridylyltransferase